MLFFALVFSAFCGKAFFTYELFNDTQCTPGNSVSYIKFNFLSQMSKLGNQIKFDAKTGCFSPKTGGFLDFSGKFVCENEKFTYEAYIGTDSCKGSPDVSTPVIEDMTKCYTNNDLSSSVPPNWSGKFRCNSEIGDDYAHMKIMASGKTDCTDNIRDIGVDLYYKVGVCIKRNSQNSVKLFAANNGTGVRWQGWTNDACTGTPQVEKTWEKPGCKAPSASRAIESDGATSFVGFGASETPFVSKSSYVLMSFTVALLIFSLF